MEGTLFQPPNTESARVDQGYRQQTVHKRLCQCCLKEAPSAAATHRISARRPRGQAANRRQPQHYCAA
eukprot:1158664-Pelagomonas_calceolata.AAC.6